MEKLYKGLILRYTNFGETSAILSIITQNQGMQSVLFHGVKKRGGSYCIGTLVEWQTSRKYTGDGLAKTSKYDIIYSFVFEGSVEKIALRDCVFELMQQSIPQEMVETNELFNLLEKYLMYLETPDSEIFFGFWLFCIRFAGFLGYQIDLKHCKKCGEKIGNAKQRNVFLSNQSGGFLCWNCHSKLNFSSVILEILSKGGANIREKLQNFTRNEKILITEQLISYIQFHCGKTRQLNSFKFFCECLNYS